MLQYGVQITRNGDKLYKISLDRLYQGIARPKQAFRDQIEQLRTLQGIDESRYRALKKQLPYFLCGIFHPAIRRKEHFASARYFVLDIDHLDRHNESVDGLFERFKDLPELALSFRSPGKNGIKLLFKIKAPCTDQALFSSFYKIFAHQFAGKHGLEEVLDFRTSDVTRACFMSYDPDAWYNPQSESIDMQAFIPDLNFDQAEKDLKEAERTIRRSKKDRGSVKKDIEGHILQKIKDKLHPNRRKPQKERSHYVPPQVDKAIAEIKTDLSTYDLQLVETRPISYGRKMKIAAKGMWAEINIFYGKKGFRLIKTSKRGSNPKLADVCVEVLEEIISTIGEGIKD